MWKWINICNTYSVNYILYRWYTERGLNTESSVSSRSLAWMTVKHGDASVCTRQIFLGGVSQSVISSCSSLCAPPVPRCLAQGGWRGSQHWWSHGSPLCWPPSYGSLEKTETKKIGNQHGHKSKWGCECSFWAPLPVRTSLKAASTLVEPNADVSMNIRPFFSESHRGLKNEKNINTEQNVFSSENTIYENFCKT